MTVKHTFALIAVAGFGAAHAMGSDFRIGARNPGASVAQGHTPVGGSMGSPAGEYRFDFTGTISDGSPVGGSSLTGTAFTFSLFVADTATNLTPGAPTANYRLSRATLDIGSDGSIEETSLPDPAGYAAVFIDLGSTVLIGGFDLFNPDISFLIGVNMPSGAFTSMSDLAAQSVFSLSGLTGSTLSYYNSTLYNLLFEVTGFSFNSPVTVVPLPAPVLMGAAGLVCAGVVAHRRKSRV